MSELKIITDYKWKDFLYGHQLPKKCRKEFDYMDQEEFETGSFVKYKGEYYSLNDFERINEPNRWKASSKFVKWTGVHGDTFFSGILIKLSNDMEQYQIGRYYQ